MPILFAETPRFPDNIAYGSSGGPGFKTTIFEGNSGLETPVQQWSRAKGKWDVSYGVRDKDDMDTLRAFFYNMRGRAIAFRFKDWGDYDAVDQLIGTGNGVQTAFQLIKVYPGAFPYTRRIFKPVNGTLVVKVNNVVVPEGVNFSCNYTNGIILFNPGFIPAATHQVLATFEFDVPCRFDVDELNAQHEGYLTETWSGITIVEKLLEEPT
jgi:uncharacterized protein (TIGR02217 family)